MSDLTGAVGESGRYQIIQAIGQGGMGVVYLGLDTELNRQVAIKTIRTDRLPLRQATSRLRREILSAAAIDHPYLCKVYDLVESQDGVLAIMEYIEGRTLSQLLEERSPSETEILRYCAEVCEALNAAHARGLVHRDIKPSNIMVTPHGHVKVTDFGLAKQVETEPAAEATRLTQPGGITGSPYYMSPELAAGDEVNQASDIFSLGVVLYRSLTGKHPFEGDSARSYLRNLLSSDPAPLSQANPGISEAIERCVMSCLQNDPEKRPKASQLAVELARLAQAQAVPAVESSRRFSARQVLLAAAGLVLLSSAVWWILETTAGPPWEGQPQPRQLALVTGPEDEVSSRISPDLNWISYVTRRGRGEDRIWLKRIGSEEGRAITEVPLEITSTAWSPDGVQIAYLSKDPEGILLQIMPAFFGGAPEASRRLEEAPAFSYPSVVRWLPGGIYLSLTADEGQLPVSRVLWRYDPRSETMEKVFAPQSSFDQIDVSSDEKQVVFNATQEGRQDLWIASLDGSGMTRLTDDPYSADWPRWSDARRRSVVFRSKRAGQSDIWQVAVGSGETRQLTSSPAEEIIHDVAHDGSLMTFKVAQETSNIWQLDAKTRLQRQITADSLLDFWPSVSSSPHQIAFQRTKPGNDPSSLGGRVFDTRILLTSRENPNDPPRQIISQGYWPNFSKDGSWLAYLVERGQPGRCAELWIKKIDDLTQTQVDPCFAKSDLDPFPLSWKAANLAWSPVRSEIAYCSSVEDSSQLKVCQAIDGDVACRTVVEAGQGLRVTDLAYAPDGRNLAFIMEWPRGEGRRQLQLLDRGTGATQVLMDDSQELLIKGWRNHGRALVVLRRASFQSSSVELLEVRTSGPARTLTTIDEASDPTNWKFEESTEVLYLTRFDGMVHNLFALPLGTLKFRQLTTNALANYRFSGLSPIGGETLYFAGQSITRDIWMIRFSESATGSGETSSKGGGR